MLLSPRAAAKLRVPKLGRPDALLLFFDAATHLKRKANGPLNIFVRDRRGWIGVDEFQETGDRLVDGILIAAGESAPECNPSRQSVHA